MKNVNAISAIKIKLLVQNKSLLLQMLFPLIFLIAMKMLSSKNDFSNDGLSSLVLAMTFVLIISIGMPITLIISEEKENKIIQTLRLSGVSEIEYIFSNFIIFFVVGIIILMSLPFIMNIKLHNFWGNYLLVSVLSECSIILLHLFIGLVVRTQLQAQIMGSFMMMITFFLVTVSSVKNYWLIKITKYSYIGSIVEFSEKQKYFSVISIIIWIVWITVFFIMNKKFLGERNDV